MNPFTRIQTKKNTKLANFAAQCQTGSSKTKRIVTVDIAPVQGQHATHQGKRGRNYSHNDIPVIHYHMDRAAVRMM